MTLVTDAKLFERDGVQHGIVAARRMVSPNSYFVFNRLSSELKPELSKVAYASYSHNLGVSILSFYRLNHIADVPPTDSITELIASTATQLEVRLGRLAFFSKKLSNLDETDFTTIVGAKLAVELISDELYEEARRYESEYASRGIELQNYPGDGEFHAHCSLAHITANAGYFKNPDTLLSLNQSASLITCNAVLMPIRRNS